MSTVLPLKAPRLALLFLTWCLGVLGGSVGINAIVKRNIQVAGIKNQVAASGIDVQIDTRSLVNPGIVLAVGCAVTSIIASIWLGLILLDMRRKTHTKEPLSTRTLPLQVISMAFASIWLLACAIPVTMTAVNGSATVTAFLGGHQLPDALVQSTQRSLGANPAYWSNDYVHLQVIPPWITLAFAIITTIVTFVALKHRKTVEYSHQTHDPIETPETGSPVEKQAVAQKEHAHAHEHV